MNKPIVIHIVLLLLLILSACTKEPSFTITISPSTVEIMEGDSYVLKVTITPEKAGNKTVRWTTSNPNLAQVDPSGKVTALQAGEATITASIETVSAECRLTIIPLPHDPVITFADSRLEKALLAVFDSNQDGKLSEGEAAAATSLDGVFGAEKGYRSFDEFRYFTGITSIPESLFADWALTSVTLPENLSAIGDYAFTNCTLLEQIVIPKNALNLGKGMLSGCSALTTVTLPKDLHTIPAFFLSSSSQLKHIELPSELLVISDHAFSDCAGLEDISIPDSVTELGESAFSGCRALTYLKLPSKLRIVNQALCAGCTSLDRCFIQSAVWKISESAFANCENMTQVFIPESVRQIEAKAWKGCHGLEVIEYLGTTAPPAGTTDMFDDTNQCPIVIPVRYWDQYKADENWGVYQDRFSLRLQVDAPEAVDLGLSVKWASMNIGASAPEDYGYFYAWGETAPKEEYEWENYSMAEEGNMRQLTRYCWDPEYGKCDNLAELLPEDDAAHINLGGFWRMPTLAEITELKENCTIENIVHEDKIEMKFTSQVPGFEGQSIILPCTRLVWAGQYIYAGWMRIWSSSICPESWGSPTQACILQAEYSNPPTLILNAFDRFVGFPVRAVCP